MNYPYGEKRNGADKLVLLGLFIVSLMIAKVVVTSKSAIRLSVPIPLGSSGLSAAMPSGNGWNLENSWTQSDNDFFIQSFFAATSPRPAIRARCRYLLTPPSESADVQFELKAAENFGTIDKTGRTAAGSITIEWAYIKNSLPASDIIAGIALLPAGRQLNIEVEYLPEEFDSAAKAFDEIVRNIRFDDNQLLSAGAAIVAELKEKGLDSFVDASSGRELFLISDRSQTPVGFTTDVITIAGSNETSEMRAVSYLYFRGQNAREQLNFFRGDTHLNEFTWKNQSIDRTAVHNSEMTLRKEGFLTVVEFAPQVRQRIYNPGPAAVPEVFLEQLLGRMIDTGKEKISVDIIQATGKISPIVFTLAALQENSSAQDAAYVVEAAFMQEDKPFEQIHFDKNHLITKRVGVPDNIYVLQRQSEQDILRYFPERAEYILSKNKLLEQYR